MTDDQTNEDEGGLFPACDDGAHGDCEESVETVHCSCICHLIDELNDAQTYISDLTFHDAVTHFKAVVERHYRWLRLS